jgi:hypothetical protein
MMANSGRDPYWHAAVRREIADHPSARAAIEDKCATCHMPMARYEAAVRGAQGAVFANLPASAPEHAVAADGVSCTVCHQISAQGLGERASFDGGFVLATAAESRPIFGPHAVDAGRQSVMHSVTHFAPTTATHVQRSELCATCHTLYTTALDGAGNVVGELPEQVPFQEWRHSDYRDERSCQSCHMPEVAGEVPISSVLGQPRPRVSQHTFRGGNSFMLGILSAHRGELGVAALPQELDTAVRETDAYLASETARVALESPRRSGAVLEFAVAVTTLSGHKLPTAYPSRRAWLHVTVTDADGVKVFESGAVGANGAIVGNANDADATRFEPHHERITRPDEVQIYESILVDTDGAVTTGLLRGVTYAKDNRLLPRGFDKATADAEIAVRGEAAADADFVGGGDRVAFRIDVGAAPPGALRIDAELLFQAVGFRWNDNLRAYDSDETRRFVRYYDAAAPGSARLLARTAVTLGADAPR